ncbi:MAG: pyridoxal phosphate-dependent aminotransferase [Candidatus Marinimicrobia bacterium]|nr:pyridoxal phosphate-dependent aminotransferase [Candidatus Neomarinimicrobiota bacterium]
MKYTFDQIINRRGTHSFKWDSGDLLVKMGFTERFDEDTLPLFLADMDFACPNPVLDALHARVDEKIFGYTNHLSDHRYMDALTGWFKRRHGWKINPESVVYSPGTVYALHVAIRAFTKPGDKIIIQRPVYASFTTAIEDNNRVVANNELLNDNGYYHINFEELEKLASDSSTTMMILCSPHNPVGRIWTPQELKEIDRVCRKHGVILVSDEIHGDLIRKEAVFYPIATVVPTDNTIICTAINKTFNTAGLHCSNIILDNPTLQKAFQKKCVLQSPSPFAISALIAAYNEGEEWLEQLKTYLDGNFDLLEAFLKESLSKVQFKRPEGTYFAWLDFSKTGLSPEEIHHRIYTQANILLEDGKIFGEKSIFFQRMCLPTPRNLLIKALERLGEVF